MKKKLPKFKTPNPVLKSEPMASVDNLNTMRNSWYARTNVTIGSVMITIVGMITGCGVLQMYGTTTLGKAKDITKEEVIKAIKQTYPGAGAVFGTLGDTFYASCEPGLLKLGFEQVAQYTNYQHSSTATQRMYILKL